jgi:diadenosine tetraphosphate (Ap4A) HIT family hydrolase
MSLLIDSVNINSILGRSDDFVIVPALGPLVVGHVLAISTEHTAGLQYLPAAIQKSYEELSIRLRRYCAQFGDTVLEAEHGAKASSIRGPCIRHTHIHILPALANADKIFGASTNLELLNETSNLPASYLWLNSGSHRRMYDASRVIGQEIRRTIGGHLGIDDWDWAVNPKIKLIAETIKYWNKINKCLA